MDLVNLLQILKNASLDSFAIIFTITVAYIVNYDFALPIV